MFLTYNSVTCEVLSEAIDRQVVYDDSGKDELGILWRCRFILTVSPDLLYLSHDPRPKLGPAPPLPTVGPNGKPVGRIEAVQQPGPQRKVSAVHTDTVLRKLLLEPKKQLYLWARSDLQDRNLVEYLLIAPSIHPETKTYDRVDSSLGPRPLNLQIQSVIGEPGTFLCSYEIEAWEDYESYKGNDADSILMGISHQTTERLTDTYSTIRETTGTAYFKASALERYKASPDNWRSGLFPRIPLGWKREGIVVTVRDNGYVVDFSYQDVQQEISVQDPGIGVAHIECNMTSALTRDADLVEGTLNTLTSVLELQQLRNFSTPTPPSPPGGPAPRGHGNRGPRPPRPPRRPPPTP